MSHRSIVPIASMLLVSIVNISLLQADDVPQPTVPVTFSQSQVTRDLIPEVRSLVVKAVQERFGDPAHPKIPDGLPVEGSLIGTRTAYSKHCARCHGAGGDGAGMDAKSLDPPPRDFRRGIFKWKSTMPQYKALRHDLRETIRVGVPGTAMPPFADLADAKSLVEYVRWQSMAGEFEIRLASEFFDYTTNAVMERIKTGEKQQAIVDEATREVRKNLPETASEVLVFIAESWKSAELESSIVRPKTLSSPKDDASIQRGRELFLANKSKCNVCHGDTGKGDGPATQDTWKIPGTNRNHALPGLHDDWGNRNQPWDLTTGKYRGGDSPEDLFRRIYAGISGTSMPAYGGPALTEAETSDLVNYVQSLQPEARRNQTKRRPPPLGTKGE